MKKRKSKDSDVTLISPYTQEAERINYCDALCILISIAFGVGYLGVFSIEDEKYTPIILLFINLVVGILSVLMLSKVRKEYSNKMGSYQELAYYFSEQTTVIYVISFQCSISLLVTCGYSFQYVVAFVSRFIYIFEHPNPAPDKQLSDELLDKEVGWKYHLSVSALLILLIFPYTLF